MKKMKIVLGSLGSATLMIPIVAVSAVACYSKEQPSISEPTITIKTQPQSQTIYLKQNENLPTLSVSATTSDTNAQMTYQWHESNTNSTTNGKPISGATQSTYTIPKSYTQEAGTKYFYAVVSIVENNSVINSVISSVATVTVTDKLPSIDIKTQPQNLIVHINQNADFPTFSVVAEPIEGALFTYQWYENSSNSTTGGTAIEGATSSSYTIKSSDIGNAATTKYFYVVVSGTINGVTLTSITSSVASLNVLASLPTLSIKTQPTNQTVYANQTSAFPTFSVVAEPIEGATFTYQWYSNTTGSTTGGTAIKGATSSTYTITKTDIGTAGATKYFYVTINGSVGNLKLTPINSNVVTLTTQAASTISISNQPTAEQVVAKNASVSLSVTATSSSSNTLIYQWQKSNSNTNDATWTDISGANSNTYTFTDANEPGTVSYYRVILSETNTDATTTSSIAKVSVGYADVAAATTVLNTWLSSEQNQKSLLESYFKNNNPLSVIGGTTGSNSSLSVPLWSYQFNTLPTATLNSLTFVEKTDENKLPFSTWEIKAKTTSTGTYQVWNDNSNTWGSNVSVPVGSNFTIYLPFNFTKAITVTSSTITPNISVASNLSTLTFSIKSKIPYNVLSGSFTPAGENQTTINFSFSNPTFYSFSNTNSDLPAYPIVTSNSSR